MRKRYRDLVLSSIAQRIRTEIGAPKALNAPLVEALEGLKKLPDGTWPQEVWPQEVWPQEVRDTDVPVTPSCGIEPAA